MDLIRMIKTLTPGMQRQLLLRAACGCDQGKKRKNNEDNFYFNGSYLSSDNHGLEKQKYTEISLNEDSFFCVYDGMGGGDFGEVASYTAANATKKFLETASNINPCDITPSLGKMCENVNRSVFQAGVKLGSLRMGSTLAGLYFHEGQVWVCNLGDSRCYLFRNGRMKQISEDHTDEDFMKENNITGRKPYLTQYLGIDPEEMEIAPYVKNYVPERGDRFLICSDGVTDMIEAQRVWELLANVNDPNSCVKAVIQEALDGGGKDNITAIVLDIV